MRGLTLIVGAGILAVVVAIVLVLREPPPGDEQPAGALTTTTTAPPSPTPTGKQFSDECGTFDTTTKEPYAVTGYFVVPTSDHCTWRRQLEAIHSVGGDTVIRIGTGLQPRSVDEDGYILDNDGKDRDRRYEKCMEDGRTCMQAAEADLKAANPRNRITWTYVYRTDEAFGPGLFRCPGMEHKIRMGKVVYYRLIAPDDGSDDPSCDYARQGRGYHLILIQASPTDSLTELLDLADQFGMRVFPALPLAPRDPASPTKANPRHIGTLTTLTRRILQDYGDRFRDRASLGGVYQPFEVQLRGWADPSKVPTLQVYAEQHLIVQQVLPGKPILISPYIDARRKVGFGATPNQVKKGFEALARTGVGIIAPQDGRGTGKGALYWPNWKNRPVDKRLRPVVGDTTYSKGYLGATRDYYRAMAAARDKLKSEDINVELWANVEAFEPAAPTPADACGHGSRGRTDKARLDAAVALAGPYVSKVISYMWSDFYTCGSPSLSEQLADDWQRPIAIEARHQGRGIQDGLDIRGYDLQGATVTVSWYGLDTPHVIDSAAVGWFDPNPPSPDLPAAVQHVWVPFDWSEVEKGTWLRVDVRGPSGLKAAQSIYCRA